MALLERAVFVAAMLFQFFVAPANAQSFGPDHLVVSPAYASRPIEVFAPVTVCFHNDPLLVIVDSTFQQNGNVITLTVHSNWGGICFSAGDPAVKKAVRFAMQQSLPVGTYTLHYVRFNGAAQTDNETVTFAVVDDPAAIPTLAWPALLLLAVILLMIGLRFSRRVGSKPQ